MATTTGATAQRSSFSMIRRKYKKIGKKNVRLTQSSLILMQTIASNTKQYTFPVLQNDTTTPVLPNEIRLNQNDEFVAYNVGYYLSGAFISTGIAPKDVAKLWLTYAPMELSSEFQNLADSWDGTLQILVNKISRLENWDLKKHNFFPRTQFQSSSVGIPAATLPSINFGADGCATMQPMLTLSGAKKNDVIITLKNSISQGATGTFTSANAVALTVTFREIALFFRGMLAQNASKFQ